MYIQNTYMCLYQISYITQQKQLLQLSKLLVMFLLHPSSIFCVYQY